LALAARQSSAASPLGLTGGLLLDAENVTGGTLGDFTNNFYSSSVKPKIGVLVPEPRAIVSALTGTRVPLSPAGGAGGRLGVLLWSWRPDSCDASVVAEENAVREVENACEAHGAGVACGCRRGQSSYPDP
jgi:hypothetical protein